MSAKTPRLRMIAGPNGSGKSRIREGLREDIIGIFVNADEIQTALETTSGLDFSLYRIHPDTNSIRQFATQHELLAKSGLAPGAMELQIVSGILKVDSPSTTGYLSTLIADFVRRKLIEIGSSFTFETVMSSSDKIDTLKLARSKGFRTYLYYVATEDPEINIARVQYRVANGGHDVPESKIRDRYYRSLGLLLDAIRNTNRAYVWDNSGSEPIWIAEVTAGVSLEYKSEEIPAWFQSAVVARL